MFPLRRLAPSVLCAAILALLQATPALASGWTVVTFDRVPTDAHAGQQLTLGLMVRQHGVTPLNDVTPLLRARNAATGETVTATARQDGAVGHFVVDLTFPSAGSWNWSATPAPFPVVELGSVTILPAVVAPPSSTNTAISGTTLATARTAARWSGVAAILLACLVGVWNQRASLVRWRLSRQ